MLGNMLPEYASRAIPLWLMLGILFAFRKLATSSELDVMRAVGLSYTRMLRVPYMITLVMVAINFANVGYLQPLARYAYEQLNYELKSGALGASIKVGEFTSLRSEEHTSELQSLMRISYAVFCLKKKKHIKNRTISSVTHN